MAIFLFRFCANVILQFPFPIFTFFSEDSCQCWSLNERATENLLCRIKHILQDYAPAGHVDVDGQRLRLSLRLQNFAPLIAAFGRSWFVCSGKFPHQCISTIIVEVYASNISIIKSTSTASTLVVVTASGAIEIASAARLRTTSTSTGECRTLELLLVALPLESLQKTGGRLRSKLIVAKTNTNWATSKIKPVHLLQSLTSLVGITKPEKS